MAEMLRTISPVDGGVYVERPLAAESEIDAALERARSAQAAWKRVSVQERGRILGRAVDAFVAQTPAIAGEISWQMGRPIARAPGEVGGFEERARYMIDAAAAALADIEVGPLPSPLLQNSVDMAHGTNISPIYLDFKKYFLTSRYWSDILTSR